VATRDLRRWLGPLALGLLGALLGLSLFMAFRPEPETVTAPGVEAAVASALESALQSATDASKVPAEVFNAILPSLVLVQTQGDAGSADRRGVGSGVVINADGSILTALHVVDGASAIRVTFADGTEAAAEVIATEPENDLAVLRADGSPEVIVPAVLGGGAQIGDPAFTVGNPLGLAASLTAGVISGLDRTVPLRSTGRELSGLIQFDAAVNPGSSGGPLLNRHGQVIGIVTALANPVSEGSFSGIGFAVPLDTAGGSAAAPPR
jgi:S1-C subfamily serine protease